MVSRKPRACMLLFDVSTDDPIIASIVFGRYKKYTACAREMYVVSRIMAASGHRRRRSREDEKTNNIIIISYETRMAARPIGHTFWQTLIALGTDDLEYE